MGSKATPRAWGLRQLKRCADCGGRVRDDREQKSCPRCGLVLPLAEYGHNRARADHRESWCRPCKRLAQRVKGPGLGRPFPITKFAAFTDGWLVGHFAGQSLWLDEAAVASRVGVVDLGYRTETDGGPVFRLVLTDVHTSNGGHPQSLGLPHTYAHLLDGTEEPFREGDPIIAVVEHGEIVKLLRVDEEAHSILVLVDEALHGYMDGERPQGEQVGFPFAPVLRSWSAVRPWMLGLVLADLTGSEAPTPHCAFNCGADANITEDHGYVCPNCTAGVEWAADTVMAVLGKVPDEDVWERMSELETTYLVEQAVAAVAA